EAIGSKILMFNVESIPELAVINAVACRLKTVQKVAIRLNPDVAPDTHDYITTGSRQNKFGMDVATVYRLFMESYRYPFVRFVGVHMHIGSQITNAKPFVKAIKRALKFIDSVRFGGNPVEYLNIGGGLGIVYSKEKPQSAEDFAAEILPLFKDYDMKKNIKLVLEPGRFISGNSGILVTKVLYLKHSDVKSFVIVDGGMNDLIRPSFYGAYHNILPVVKKSGRIQKIMADVVGPICESGDFLGKNRKMAFTGVGDLLAVMSCGAYGFVMSSNYNSRPRVPEIVVKGSRFFVARKRETRDDLIHNEKIISQVV
ncbi:MAG: diaminopimelate decarboxylase, partial [Candidatus Omnitrophica bacterium CG1_02_46_14]